ncbi:Motile sperm domain-containing protein 2 [Orchesella cincta]|uniref:Motile sperm domain-containing protein 2 n=1 Tax=Orchesella cincta TaxID=48709 RepID=A0A1D2MJE7_ORCCI|nr:Motile sperm domain-containing protein 2 [Orchesella cincta]
MIEPTSDRMSRIVDDGNYDNGSPTTSHSSSPVRAAFQQGGTQAFVTLENEMLTDCDYNGNLPPLLEHCLAEVDERITFKPTENDEYSCRLHIQNIAQGSSSIVFKIKTTSPDRYRVRPTIAVIEPGATAKVPITTYPGVSASQIGRDRFQVQVCILPKDMVNEESCESMNSSNQSLHNSNLADLTSVFKKLINSPGTAIDTFKVAVGVEARAGDTAVGGPTVSMNEERMRKGLDDLEKKITDSVYNKVQPKVDRMMLMMYVIVAVLVVLLAMQWLNSRRSVVDCGQACPDFVPRSECSANNN